MFRSRSRHADERADQGAGGSNDRDCNRGHRPFDRSADGTDKSTYGWEGNEADPLEDIICLIGQKVLHDYPLVLMRIHDFIIHVCTRPVESQFIMVMVVYVVDLLLVGS